MKRKFQIEFLRSMGLKPNHKLIDIGCGTLRGGIPLIKHLDNNHYFGIEVREDVLKEAENELLENNLTSKQANLILSNDISQLRINVKFDYLWAFSVLIHMKDEILDNTFSFVEEHIKDSGIFYASAIIRERKQSEWQGFPVVSRSIATYKSMASKYNLALENIGPLTEHGHVMKKGNKQVMLKIVKNPF